MKPIITTILSLMMVTAFSSVQAQNVYVNDLSITKNKTTSIVFGHAIKSVDLGSPDVLAQKVEGAENVLQLKAGKQDFLETNVTVITEVGVLHQFNVRYSSAPSSLYFVVNSDGAVNSVETVLFTEATSTDVFEKSYSIIQSKKGQNAIKKAKSQRLTLFLKGIYIDQDKLFFDLGIVNDSHLPFDIESARFFIRDKKQAKRSAIQEVELNPIHMSNNTRVVNPTTSVSQIIAFDKFTITSDKELVMEISEKDGGRTLTLTVKSKSIDRAKPVNAK
jgi:conjugative transposon TraN protein